MPTAVTNVLINAAGSPAAGVKVVASLVGGGFLEDGSAEVIRQVSATTGSDGRWTLNLTPTGDFADTGAHYLVREDRYEWRVTVPATGGPHQLFDVLVDTAPASGLLVGLSQAEADARYALLGHTHTPGQVGILILDADDPVPTGTPAGTVIFRTP